jgi:4-aminobutyrate aminotransferase-like enzyme
VSNRRLEVGGIFLEPITASKGLFFFRPSFLEKLRLLADELNVPIMADEIFTGGGRTGQFWAVSHYGDFRPDLMTFGKGLGISGVAQFTRRIVVGEGMDARYETRWKWPSFENTSYSEEYTYPAALLDNTSRVNPLVLIQALQILKRIHYDHLEMNAAAVGTYALEKLKQKAKRMGFENDVYGIGLLFDVGPHTDELVGKNKVKHYQGRWSPPLTLTKEDFDILLGP